MSKTTLIISRARLIRFSSAACLCLSALNANAGGAMALPFQSVTDSGMGFAAGVTDQGTASSMWFNPASLGEVTHAQASSGGTAVYWQTGFTGQATRAGTDGSSIGGRNGAEGNNGGNPGGINPPLPQLYYAKPLPNWQGRPLVFGFGVNTPYAIIEQFDENWVGRYHGIDTIITTVNFNPALAWQPHPRVWLGAGMNVSLWASRFSNDVDIGAIVERRIKDTCQDFAGNSALASACALVTPSGLGGRYDFYNELDAIGPGFGINLGARWQINRRWALGGSYRSYVSHLLRGNAERDRFGNGWDGNPGWDADEFRNDPDLQGIRLFLDTQAPINPDVEDFATTVVQPVMNGSADGKYTLRVQLPDRAWLGLRYESPQWTFLVAGNYTHWERFNQFRFEFDDGRASIQAYSHFKNAYRGSVGGAFRPNQQWELRGGFAYEAGAVDDNTRTVRSPDGERRYFTTGIGYRWKPNLKLDASLGYMRAAGGRVNDVANESGSGNLITGQFDDFDVYYGALQLTLLWGKPLPR